MLEWQSLGWLAGIVAFWVLIFCVAVFTTRWALHGVGEITPEERADLGMAGGGSASANGRRAPRETSPTTPSGH
jgi:hypothetical protein